MSKQCTFVTSVSSGRNANSWVLQFVAGSISPRLPKYLISICTGLAGAPVILYSPLIATSPGKHTAVELAKKPVVEEGVDGFPSTE